MIISPAEQQALTIILANMDPRDSLDRRATQAYQSRPEPMFDEDSTPTTLAKAFALENSMSLKAAKEAASSLMDKLGLSLNGWDEDDDDDEVTYESLRQEVEQA